MFLYYVELVLELLQSRLHQVPICKVDHKGQRYHVPHIMVVRLTVLLEVLEQLVLLCQIPMEFKVVDKRFLAVLPQEVELNLTRVRGPLEVKDRRNKGWYRLPRFPRLEH